MSASDADIRKAIRVAVYKAAENDDFVLGPTAIYVPFSYGKEGGFLVVTSKEEGVSVVVTAAPEHMCTEVKKVLEEKRHGVLGQIREVTDLLPNDPARGPE